METFTIILIIIAVLVLAVFVFLLYSGFFYTYSIRCTVPASLPTRFAYTVHVGPYEKVGSVFGKLNSLVPQKRLFGVYYDNPEKVMYFKWNQQLATSLFCMWGVACSVNP